MDINLTTPLLSKDTPLEFQPKGTSPFILNALPESSNGEHGYTSSEKGNLASVTLTAGYDVIGSISLDDESMVVFSVSSTSSEIGYVNKSNVYTVLVNDPCLNFSIENQIEGTFRILKGCNRIIYWGGEGNWLGTLDVDHILDNPTDHRYLTGGVLDCSKVRLFREYQTANVELNRVTETGGNLRYGVYQIALYYLDQDLNPTDVFTISNPIPIVDGNYNTTPYKDIEGGHPDLKPPTNKSILYDISNIDERFNYLGVVMIETVDGVSTPYYTDTIPISSSTAQYRYGGINYDEAVQADMEWVTRNPTIYESAKTITQAKSSLILANLEEKHVDYAAFQQAANNITSGYYTLEKEGDSITPSTSGDTAKTPRYYFDTRTFPRDEVIAVGVEWKFKDGFVTPPFHIPGRAKITDPSLVAIGNANSHNRPTVPNTQWDDYLVTNIADTRHIASASGAPSSCGPISVDVELTPKPGDQLMISYIASITNLTNPTSQIEVIISNSTPASETHYITVDADGSGLATITSTIGVIESVEIGINFTTDDGCTYADTHVYGDPAVNSSYTFNISSPEEVSPDYERWQIYNTAIRETTTTPGVHTEGKLAYWESEIDYPNTTDCSGTRIFPTGKIRHHKMPDTTLEPIFNLDGTYKIYPAGLKFDNIAPPAGYEDLVEGYRIVVVERTEDNTSVVDGGLMLANTVLTYNTTDFEKQHISQSNTYYGRSLDPSLTMPFPIGIKESYLKDEFCGVGSPVVAEGTSGKHFSFHSPLSKFRRDYMSGDFVKIEREVQGRIGWHGWNSTTREYNSVCRFVNQAIPVPTNRMVTAQAYLAAGDILTAGVLDLDFVNIGQQETLALDTYDVIAPPSTLTDNSSDDPNSVANTYAHAYYALMKRYMPRQYGYLHTLSYINTHNNWEDSTNTSFLCMGGDSFITQLSVRKTRVDGECGSTDESHWKSVPWFWCESRVNSELRHIEDHDSLGQKYYPKYYYDDATELAEFFDIEYSVANEYFYNEDYSLMNNQKKRLALPQSFDYCSVCRNKYPHRYVHSRTSYQEESVDSYRIFDALNYRDLQGNTGEIIKAISIQDELSLLTEDSMWFQPLNAQTLQTDTSTIYLGTGEMFSQDPREIGGGYSGTQSQWAVCSTKRGFIYPNQKLGTVILTDGKQLKEISDVGMSTWFKTNLRSHFNDQYHSAHGEDYPLSDNPANPIGIGVIATYDPRYKRYIITKRDYSLITGSIVAYDSEAGIIHLNINDGAVESIGFDPQYFEDKSWTLSFSVDRDGWLSFHSFLPHIYFECQTKFYSRINGLDTSLWQHGIGEYQTYYGTKHPLVADIVYNEEPTVTKVANVITYIAYVKENGLDIHDDTFTSVNFSNSRQISGDLPVQIKSPFGSVNYQANRVHAEKTEENWNISDIWDYRSSTADSIFTDDWADVNYQAAYPIDKVPNQNAYDQSKSPFDTARMRDKYLVARMSYLPAANRNINFTLSGAKLNRSPR